ncbi:MAG: ACP S-malonyltransferase [Thermoleophilia bacterium]
MIVAMFPGQGSQVVGMGSALADAFPTARRTFEEADDVLGYALSEICFAGPAERLTQTDVCQPALVAASTAAFRVAREEAGLTPALVIGHSLGEYSALVAAGAMGFAEALRIVSERGAAMRAAGAATPGAMVAVLGLGDDDVRELAAEAGDAWPANYNCPGQVVVSGTLAAIERLEALAGDRGARTARLAVDGAFHSPLVAQAADRLRPALDAWGPVDPDPPFLSTTTVAVEPPARLREILVDQVTAPVRFGDGVQAAIDMGAERFVEVGPGKVLSGLVRRVQRGTAVGQLGEPADVDALAAA